MDKPRWAQLLEDAVRKPGAMHECYHRFHGYSIGNQWLALWQCYERDLEPGPISTYRGWQLLGRQVMYQQKGLTLCMPVTINEKGKDDDGNEVTEKKTIFVFKPNWFVLAQTSGDGAVPEAPDLGDWSLDRVLENLGIKRAPFDMLNGNIQGFARQDAISVSPVADHPIKTGIHEAAHVLLGHTKSVVMIVDAAQLTYDIGEVEAESVALIVSDALGLPGQEYSRGYIQNWWKRDEAIPEKSASRIFAVADKILKAGYEQAAMAKAA